jgi:hypothetical protein
VCGQDPHALRSLLVRPFSTRPAASSGSGDDTTKVDLISTFTEDRHVLAFARHFCDAAQVGNLL